MANITLSQLIQRARDRADMPTDSFVTDAMVTDWLNDGLQHLHKLLVDAFETEYAFKEYAVSFVSGTTDYALPSDFYRLYGIDLTFAGRTRSLRPYNQGERNAFKNRDGAAALWYASGPGASPRYSLIKNAASTGSMVRLLPMNISAPGTVLYAPSVVALVNPSDTVELPDGWERYPAYHAAVQMLGKEESSTTEVQKQLDRWEAELLELKQTRDAAFPRKTVDMDRAALDDLDDYP